MINVYFLNQIITSKYIKQKYQQYKKSFLQLQFLDDCKHIANSIASFHFMM